MTMEIIRYKPDIQENFKNQDDEKQSSDMKIIKDENIGEIPEAKLTPKTFGDKIQNGNEFEEAELKQEPF